jgi:hypothetical protein
MMSRVETLPFIEYLEVKRTVDDRAINRHVLSVLRAELGSISTGSHLNILEVGAGIGTMVTRLMDWEVISAGDYTAVDINPSLVKEGRRKLGRYAHQNSLTATCGLSKEIILQSHDADFSVNFKTADVLEYCRSEEASNHFNLLIAHAFLDLLDLPTALPVLLHTLQPGSLFYFTLNFDGITHFEPPINPVLDAQIESLYHATMDERVIDDQRSGDHHTGRRLLGELQRNNADILAAGASDWLVHPIAGSYPAHEACFLHHILDTIEGALKDKKDLDPEVLAEWLQERRSQVDAGNLIYLAHQIDVLGRRRSPD